MQPATKDIRRQIAFDHIAVLPGEISYNIEALTKAIGNIAGRFGCPACCSGRDILFKTEETLLRDVMRSFDNDFIVTRDMDVKRLSAAFRLEA